MFIFFASPKKTNQKKRAPRLGIFRLRGENRLVSSASLPLLNLGASCDYSEPREDIGLTLQIIKSIR